VLSDAERLVKTCEACQFHVKDIHQPAQALQTIPLSWPFAVYGLDSVGHFPRAVGGYEYLLVVVDKFTKWVEVEPVRAVMAQATVKFIRGIVSRFGVPNRIIANMGPPLGLPLHQRKFQSLLQRAQHKGLLCLGSTPQRQLSGGACQCESPMRTENKDI
jgi:hypothetical protein